MYVHCKQNIPHCCFKCLLIGMFTYWFTYVWEKQFPPFTVGNVLTQTERTQLARWKIDKIIDSLKNDKSLAKDGITGGAFKTRSIRAADGDLEEKAHARRNEECNDCTYTKDRIDGNV